MIDEHHHACGDATSTSVQMEPEGLERVLDWTNECCLGSQFTSMVTRWESPKWEQAQSIDKYHYTDRDATSTECPNGARGLGASARLDQQTLPRIIARAGKVMAVSHPMPIPSA